MPQDIFHCKFRSININLKMQRMIDAARVIFRTQLLQLSQQRSPVRG